MPPRLVVGAHRVLRLIFEAAVGYGVIPLNPAAKLKLPAADPDRDGARRVLSEADLSAFLNHPGQGIRVETMLRAAAEGGLRRAEICGLRWSDVNLTEGRIEVLRGYEGGQTKTHQRRAVNIGADFRARLKAWRGESVLSGGANVRGPVWPGRSGGEMAEHSATQACTRAMVRAGLVDAEGRHRVTLHGLRHTCASLMLSRGVHSSSCHGTLGTRIRS